MNYEEYGYGLWIIEAKSGQFVGDCGLTWQAVNDRPWPRPRLVDTRLSGEVKIRGLG